MMRVENSPVAPNLEARLPSDQPISGSVVNPRLVEQPDGVFTALGGVWFLVNLLVELDLLGDDPVSPWLKLEALARRLLPDAPDDALWLALSELAGQEDTPEDRARAERWMVASWPALEGWLLQRLVSLDQLALVKPARLYVTRTHIDLVFSLEDIDLRMRVIGLDRDPGWLPELGRVITFHFE